MLATPVESILDLTYPCLASPKLDGIRCLVLPGHHAVSRNWKPIPNNFIRNWLESNAPVGLDGELMISNGKIMADFSQVTSGIMSEDGTPDFYYAVFDYVANGDLTVGDLTVPFQQRILNLAKVIPSTPEFNRRIKIVPQVQVNNATELQTFYEQCLKQGYEGSMLRSLNGPYKCGRSSLREGYLLKVKPFDSEEAVILGVQAQRHNANEAELNAFGNIERSSHKENMIELPRLGAVTVRDLKTGVEFSIGSGFDDLQRDGLWKENLIGRVVKYKCQGSTKLKPRFPVFLSFRDRRDMD